MELWVRSQDKEALTKVNMGVMYWKDINERNCIVNKDNATGFSILGTYKTKERALEILDEINEILQLKLCTTLGTFEELFNGYTEKQLKLVLKQMAVYEMPKE